MVLKEKSMFIFCNLGCVDLILLLGFFGFLPPVSVCRSDVMARAASVLKNIAITCLHVHWSGFGVGGMKRGVARCV